MRLSSALHGDDKWSIGLWAVVESTTAICVASAPALRPLVFRTGFINTTSRGPSSRAERHTHGLSANGAMIGESYDLEGVKVTTTVQVTSTDIRDTNSECSTSYEGIGKAVVPYGGEFSRFEAKVRAGDFEVV